MLKIFRQTTLYHIIINITYVFLRIKFSGYPKQNIHDLQYMYYWESLVRNYILVNNTIVFWISIQNFETIVQVYACLGNILLSRKILYGTTSATICEVLCMCTCIVSVPGIACNDANAIPTQLQYAHCHDRWTVRMGGAGGQEMGCEWLAGLVWEGLVSASRVCL